MQVDFSRLPVTGQIQGDYVWNGGEWVRIKRKRDDVVLKKLDEILERLERLEGQRP